MPWPAIIGAVAAVGSAASSAIGAAQSSGQAAAGFGTGTIQAQREHATNIINDYMSEGLNRYVNGVQDAQNQISMGKIGAMQILQDSTGQAQQMLTDLGVDAQKAIMGDAAQTGGIPFSSFSTQYDQVQSLPPTARTAAMGELTKQVGSSVAQVTGTDPVTATQTLATDTGIAATQPDVAQAATMDAQAAQQPALSAAMQQDVQGQQTVEQAAAAQAAGAQTGFYGAKSQLELGRLAASQQLQQGTQTARSDIASGAQTALGQIAQGTESALARYSPYSEAGQAAIQQEAALSGAMGSEAQQAAIDAYIESPGQKYLREQQEKALLRSSAAIGGLGGGAVRTALQEQAMGIASTQQQQYLENLRSIATRGQDVAGSEAGLLSQQGYASADVTTQASQQLANLANQLGVNQADLMSMSATQLSNLAQSTGLSLAQLQKTIGLAQVDQQQQLGTNLANLQESWGTQASNLANQSAQTQLGQYNLRGSNLANIVTGTGAAQNQAGAAAAQAQAAGTNLQYQALSQGLSGLGQIAGYYAGQNTTNNNTWTGTA